MRGLAQNQVGLMRDGIVFRLGFCGAKGYVSTLHNTRIIDNRSDKRL